MAKNVVYSVFDTAAACYLRPFTAISDGQASRIFSDLCNDKDHEFGKHPEDYSLTRHGQFDDNLGELLPEQREVILTGLEAVALHRKNTPNTELLAQTTGEVN